MKIEQKNNSYDGVFLAKEDDDVMGEMTYEWVDDSCFAIDHTGVKSKYQRQGVGKSLVRSGVDYARKNQYTIIPVCAFARAEFDRNAEYADIRKV